MIKSFNLGLLFTTGYQTLFTITPTSNNTSRVVDINRSKDIYLISFDQFMSVLKSLDIYHSCQQYITLR